MCGIAGIVGPGVRRPAWRAWSKTYAIGGPGDNGVSISPSGDTVLGNCRPSILDLSPAGHMPLSDSEPLCITYNSELYNSKELRWELAHDGYPFPSDSDTEVVLDLPARMGRGTSR